MDSRLILSPKKRKTLSKSKIKLLSPAKINLYLNIIGKYRKGPVVGFHKIESIVERISLCDEITIETVKRPTIKIFSNIKSIKNNENICFKAANFLKNKFKLKIGFNIFLKKNIPIGSGLGGGSSNAASTLLGINEMLSLNLKKDELQKIGSKLGSDVNFFLNRCPFAYLEGKGDIVTPLNIKRKFNHFIIWPGVPAYTKNVYKKVKSNLPALPAGRQAARQELTKFFNNVKILQYALSRGDALLIEKNIFNALEQKALSLCKEAQKVKTSLENNGIFCKMTGSGSAFYTVGNISHKKIKSVLQKNWHIFEVCTF